MRHHGRGEEEVPVSGAGGFFVSGTRGLQSKSPLLMRVVPHLTEWPSPTGGGFPYVGQGYSRLMAPRTKTISPEERKAVLKHMRRAPTPSGVYACECLYCGAIFGGSRPNQKFCSKGHNNAYQMERHRERKRIEEARRIETEARIYDRPLNEMQYTLSRGWAMAADPRAEPAPEEVGQEQDEGWDLPDE